MRELGTLVTKRTFFRIFDYFEKLKNKIQRSKVLWDELKSNGTPFGPKLLFIN